MTLAEYNSRKIPPYYDTMYLDGYAPQEIYQAHKKRMIDEFIEKRKTQQLKL